MAGRKFSLSFHVNSQCLVSLGGPMVERRALPPDVVLCSVGVPGKEPDTIPHPPTQIEIGFENRVRRDVDVNILEDSYRSGGRIALKRSVKNEPGRGATNLACRRGTLEEYYSPRE